MPDLVDGQYELNGLVLGAGTPYRVTRFEDGGLPGRRVGDQSSDYDDGVSFGRDWFDGINPTLEALVETTGGAASSDAVNAMLGVWRGDRERRDAGSVAALRVKRAGAPTRRLYGRPRACTPVRSQGTGVGLVPVVAEFAGVDDRWYADTPTVHVLPIVPASTGGIVTTADGGLTGPITTAAATARPGIITNPGDTDTWPVITIRGPVSGPSVELLVAGASVWRVEFPITLAADASITIDTRPWVRTILRQDGANFAGKRTPRSTPLRLVTIPRGTSTVLFRGTSLSGTASAEVRYEAAYTGH